MAEQFLLRAVPDIVPAGPHKGYLGYVTFFATNGVETLRWFSTNRDRYLSDFADFVGWQKAEDILEKLSRGENATFPGTWSLDVLTNAEFLGIRSPIAPRTDASPPAGRVAPITQANGLPTAPRICDARTQDRLVP